MKLWYRARRLAAVGVVGLAGAGLMAGCSSTPARSTSASVVEPAPPSPPLASALTDAAGSTWAALAMGHPAGENLFWELFVRVAGSSSWRLVTPPGVADNGGLVLATTATELLAGFLPSQYLHFSPLASTDDGGRSWVPGLLPGPLVSGPDSLAAGSADLYALLSNGGGEVVTSRGGISTWARLTDRTQLTAGAAGRGCRPARLTALAWVPEGPLVGGTCAEPGGVALWAERGGAWSRAAPAVAGGMSRRRVGILRLQAQGGVLMALLDAPSTYSQTIVAAWSPDGGSSWSRSSALVVPAADRVVSAGAGSAQSVQILLRAPGGRSVLEVGGAPGTGWAALPEPPAGTQVVVTGPTGTYTALAARGSVFSAYSTRPGRGGWVRTQVRTVAVPYGTSS